MLCDVWCGVRYDMKCNVRCGVRCDAIGENEIK